MGYLRDPLVRGIDLDHASDLDGGPEGAQEVFIEAGVDKEGGATHHAADVVSVDGDDWRCLGEGAEARQRRGRRSAATAAPQRNADFSFMLSSPISTQWVNLSRSLAYGGSA